MKILITGGTGTISSALAQAAVEQNHEVFTVNRGNHPERDPKGVQVIHADLYDFQGMETALGAMRFDVVVECLAYDLTHMHDSLEHYKNRCEQYVFISTAGVYQRTDPSHAITEDDKLEQKHWQYTREKIRCEEYLEKFAAQNGLSYTIVRPTVTYGDYRIPYPVACRPYPWTLFQRILEEKPILSCNNVPFATVHSSDFARLVTALYGNSQAYGEAFHIVTLEEPHFWDDTIWLAQKELGKCAHVVHVPLSFFRSGMPDLYEDLRWNKADALLLSAEKLKSAVGNIEPHMPLEKGIPEIVRSMREEYQENKMLNQAFDLQCDVVLWEFWKKGRPDASERQILDEYFGTMQAEQKDKIRLQQRRNKLQRVRLGWRKLKKTCRNCIARMREQVQ